MKYFKNVLLAVSFIATSMSMSLPANAVLIQQDIFLDVTEEVFDDVGHGLTQTLNQLIGSVLYDTDDADINGEIALVDTSIQFNIGGVMLTEADVLGADPILLAADAVNDGILNFIVDFEFLLNGFEVGVTAIADTDFGGLFALDDELGPAVFGETRLGGVNLVPVSEPSAIILMLLAAGFGLRRRQVNH